MTDRLEELKDVLVRENEEFRRLHEKHKGFEERLAALNGKVFLTEQEKLESTKLKKEKLLLKDRMAAIARDYAPRAAGPSGR
jgi:uncharacterized protein YdcH (DUF465 family)